MPIKFYRLKEPFGEFSNFAYFEIKLDGFTWKTNEHYFQAQKYINTVRFEMIANAKTPREAADLGRDRSLPLRKDWESVKDDVMRRCVFEKFNTHLRLKALLLSTGTEEIIEDSPIDYYWGIGKNGTGKNMLGIIIMEARDKFKNDIR